MLNRIRQLRKQKNLSQKEFAKDFNEYVSKNEMDITPINFSVVSKWETRKSAPTKATYKALAKYFNVNEIYLRGAYSKAEILKVLQEYYLRYFMGDYSIDIENMIYMDIGNAVDDFVISKNIRPWNIKKENVLLSKEEASSAEFWWEHFQVVFDHIAIIWLLTKPSLNATKKDVIDALLDALSGEDNAMLLTRRTNFLDKYRYIKKDKTVVFIYDFDHAHPLDNRDYYVKDGKYYYMENNKPHYLFTK